MDGSFFSEEGRRVKYSSAADRSVPVVGRSRLDVAELGFFSNCPGTLAGHRYQCEVDRLKQIIGRLEKKMRP